MSLIHGGPYELFSVRSLEAAQRALSTPPLPVLSVQESAPPKQQARRRSSKSKRRVP